MPIQRARRGFTVIGLLIVLAAWSYAAGAEVHEFELKEISGFEVSYGHGCSCQDEPMAGVTYPALVSAKPCYGEIRVDTTFNQPTNSGTLHRYVIDESNGTDSGYDRLYIDLDGDGDLTDENPLAPMDNPPKVAHEPRDDKPNSQRVSFDYVTFSNAGENGQIYSSEVMPRLRLNRTEQQQYASLWLVPTKAWRGEIEIAGRRFIATVCQNRPMGTRFDRPLTSLELEPLDNADRLAGGIFSDRLAAMHKVDDQFWSLSTTPAGDRLFVTRYEGDFGTLTMNSGRLFAQKSRFSGTLMSENRVVLVGEDYSANPEDGSVQSCSLPVGDYLPIYFGFRDDPMIATISDCRHLDGHLGEPIEQHAYPVKIRKDETCVFEPLKGSKVLFVSPQPDTRITLGQNLPVKAVLVDPKLGIMIEHLRRKDQPVFDLLSPQVMLLMAIVFIAPLIFWFFAGREGQYRFIPFISIFGLLLLAGCLAAGRIINKHTPYNPNGMQGFHYLEPSVKIGREDGQIVAQGQIRNKGDGKYTWRVPENFEMMGDQEVFTITVIYDTKELHGSVVGKRKVTLCRN